MLFSGNADENSAHEKGVGLLLSKKAYNSIMEWEPISERILVARFQSSCQNVSIIQVYAPTDQAEMDIKQDFYEALQQTVNKISRRDIIILMGDLNAKIGKVSTNNEVMGNQGLGNQNHNGELFIDFCATNGLIIGGSLFPHKDIHKATWRSPDGRTENQIDHIAISRKWKRNIQDTRVMRSADIGSDHHLLVSTVRIKLAVLKKPKNQRTKFDVSKLKNRDVQEQFKLTLANKYDVLYNGSDVEEEEENQESVDREWENIKNMYISSCEEILGKRKINRKEWMSENTWKLVEERRNLKDSVDRARTRAQNMQEMEKYYAKDKEVKNSCRRDKLNQSNKMAGDLQTAAARNDIGTVYSIARKLSGKRSIQKKPVKNKDGVLLGKIEHQLHRWREHFQEVLNRPSPEDPIQLAPATTDLKIRTGPISKAEIRKSIKKIKNGKAAGVDNIPPEALKIGGEVTVDALHSLLLKIWNIEAIPSEWNRGLLAKLPKKGDLTQCKNWRGIMLLVISSKIMTRVLLERMKEAMEAKLRDEQAGFRAGRSCCDQIATLRIVIEQSLEWNSGLYMTFVDFEKAFDSVDHSTLWSLLRHYGVPEKIVKMIRVLYENFEAKVIHEGTTTEGFQVKTGVKQGCLLSPLLFLIALDWVTRESFKTKKTGVQWTLSSQLEDLEFADDLCLLSQKVTHMRQKVNNLKKNAERVGLKINTEKTKEMRVMTPANTGPIRCGDEAVERVKQFKYLGSIVSDTGGTEEDVKSRKRSAQYMFTTLKPIWRSKAISLKTKLKIYNSSVKTILLYGSETWRLNKSIITQIQAFNNKNLRYLTGIWWPKKISNEELWKMTDQERLITTIRRRKYRWIGHTLRKPDSSITRQALDWNPQGKRQRGRPRQSWRRTTMEELETIGITWREAKERSQHRVRWRQTVEALCTTRSEMD